MFAPSAGLLTHTNSDRLYVCGVIIERRHGHTSGVVFFVQYRCCVLKSSTIAACPAIGRPAEVVAGWRHTSCVREYFLYQVTLPVSGNTFCLWLLCADLSLLRSGVCDEFIVKFSSELPLFLIITNFLSFSLIIGVLG